MKAWWAWLMQMPTGTDHGMTVLLEDRLWRRKWRHTEDPYTGQPASGVAIGFRVAGVAAALVVAVMFARFLFWP